MTKDIKRRKTTLEERIRIVEYWISYLNDYASAAKEFNFSFGQVYSWVKNMLRTMQKGQGMDKDIINQRKKSVRLKD